MAADVLAAAYLAAASAGLYASPCNDSTPGAVRAMERRGHDLRAHSTVPLTDAFIRRAVVVRTMTAEHRDEVVRRCPNAAPLTELFFGCDVDDPLGHGDEAYEICARELETQVKKCVAEVVNAWNAPTADFLLLWVLH